MNCSLSSREQEILEFIEEALMSTGGTAPSFEEIGFAFGTCKSNAHRLVAQLQRRGYIDRHPGLNRSMTVTRPITERTAMQARAERLLARWHEAGLLSVIPDDEMLRELVEMAS